MARADLCVLLVVCLCVCVLAREDSSVSVHRRTKRGIFSSLGGLFGLGRPDCGSPDSCPTHHCRLDDAVVHGFCCGCARKSDRVPVNCPPWIKCPISPIPLCDDYNWMMDCCC